MTSVAVLAVSDQRTLVYVFGITKFQKDFVLCVGTHLHVGVMAAVLFLSLKQ
jgi:hypothetical protein